MSKRAKRSPYTRERKAEALALARIAGAEVASERSRIPVQTIRRWMDAAGMQPGAELPQDRLEALRDLAEATVTRDLVEGRIHGVQAMTVAGIARRHIAKPSPILTDESAPAVSVREPFMDWLVETVGASLDASGVVSEADMEATVEAIDAVKSELLLRRANAEIPAGVENTDSRSSWEVTPHRAAILAWFSGRQEIPAGDVLEWAKAQVLDVLATHGSLAAWHAHAMAEETAERAERERMTADIQAKAKALREASVAAAHEARLDDATRELLEEAHRILRESADA